MTLKVTQKSAPPVSKIAVLGMNPRSRQRLLELWSPADGSRVLNVSLGRHCHSAVRLSASKLLVCGGLRWDQSLLSSCAYLDIGSGAVSAAAPPIPVQGASPPRQRVSGLAEHASCIATGAVYVSGGYTKLEEGGYVELSAIWKLDLGRTGKALAWEKLPTAMAYGRSNHAMASDGTSLFIFGGFGKRVGSKEKEEILASAESVDLRSNSRRVLPDIPGEPRMFRSTAAYHDGRFYLAGGLGDGDNGSTRLDVYDPLRRRWSPGPSLNMPRQSFGLVVMDGALWAVAGTFGVRDDFVDTVEVLRGGAWQLHTHRLRSGLIRCNSFTVV